MDMDCVRLCTGDAGADETATPSLLCLVASILRAGTSGLCGRVIEGKFSRCGISADDVLVDLRCELEPTRFGVVPLVECCGNP